MESPAHTPSPDLRAAQAALDGAASVAQRMHRQLEYPPGFVPQMTAVAALSSIVAGLAGSEQLWTAVLTVLLASVMVGVALAGQRRFEAHNGVRVRSLSGPGRRGSMLFLVAGIGLNLGIFAAALATGLWWLGLALAPLAAANMAIYLRRWLLTYRAAA